MRYVVLDTETTGYCRDKSNVAKGHRVIEIACVELLDGNPTGNTFHSYINPQRKISKKAANIHGIKDGDLIDKPLFKDIVCEFVHFITDCHIIIHNASFDIDFINQEFNLLPKKLKPIGKTFYFIDTLGIARNMFPGQDNSLDGLIARFQIDVDRGVHGALVDSKILARVWKSLNGIS